MLTVSNPSIFQSNLFSVALWSAYMCYYDVLLSIMCYCRRSVVCYCQPST